MNNSKFKELGFFKEYYVGNKLIGTVLCEKDRDIGYAGRQTEMITEPIIFENGKKLKAGVEAFTMIYPLCGKLLNKTI